jgi:hypothetical protein
VSITWSTGASIIKTLQVREPKILLLIL